MRIGERVELHLGTDAWMRGDRYGTIVAVVERHGVPTSVRVKMDKSGRVLRLDPSRVEAISRLYDAADDYEASMIEDVAVRAGLVWKCACGWANRPKDRRCDGCKAKRPVEPEMPPCVRSMRCYCVGHANGLDVGEPCDTNEENYR